MVAVKVYDMGTGRTETIHTLSDNQLDEAQRLTADHADHASAEEVWFFSTEDKEL